MDQTLRTSIFILLLFQLMCCNCQSNQEKTIVSNDFDKSPPIYFGMPEHIDSRDTSPAWKLDGQKLQLSGFIYENDGKTPAPNVIMYYYQTDPDGIYLHKETEIRSVPPNRLGQTHGYIRGWVKSDSEGKYSIFTIKPGSYPSRAEAAHIHVYIKELNRKDPYYIDNFVFDDDELLTAQKRKNMENRGGSGVIQLKIKDNFEVGERNIILGRNIPYYSIK